MGFTVILAFIVLIIMIFGIRILIAGIRKKDWRMIIFPIVGIILVAGGTFLVLLMFITSM